MRDIQDTKKDIIILVSPVTDNIVYTGYHYFKLNC